MALVLIIEQVLREALELMKLCTRPIGYNKGNCVYIFCLEKNSVCFTNISSFFCYQWKKVVLGTELSNTRSSAHYMNPECKRRCKNTYDLSSYGMTSCFFLYFRYSLLPDNLWIERSSLQHVHQCKGPRQIRTKLQLYLFYLSKLYLKVNIPITILKPTSLYWLS